MRIDYKRIGIQRVKICFRWCGEGRGCSHYNSPVSPSSPNKILIEVGDSGCGISDEAVIENPPTLGLQLVQMLTKQLGGTLSFEWGSKTKLGGTEIRIIFPEATKNKEQKMGKNSSTDSRGRANCC